MCCAIIFFFFNSHWKSHIFHDTSSQSKSFVSFGVLYKGYLSGDTGCDVIKILDVMLLGL